MLSAMFSSSFFAILVCGCAPSIWPVIRWRWRGIRSSPSPSDACGWEHSGNIQGTFSRKKGTFREHSVNIQETFREYSGNIQETFSQKKMGTVREHSGNIQGTFREH
jgi:hypothetical protein